MAISVLVEGYAKDNKIQDIVNFFEEAFKITRNFDGCLEIYLTINSKDKNNFIMIEKWKTKEHFDKYVKYRTEKGTIDELISMCKRTKPYKVSEILPI
tara:strand:+ start:194 stop:487 length:294 start_codon:yes stop_codon:yes gene_type:complete